MNDAAPQGAGAPAVAPSLAIVSGEEAARQRPRINKVILGPTGIGKTSLLWTLPPKETLFLDMEAGGLAVEGYAGDRLNVLQEANKLGVHPWQLAQAIACVIAGPDMSDANGPYGPQAYKSYIGTIDPKRFEKYSILFIDSITQVSRWSFEFTKAYDPDAFSEKTGKPDTRGAYGAHGRKMVKWLTVLQHQAKREDGHAKSVITVGILDPEKDDLGRIVGWNPQIVGGMAGRELPGIFDEVISMISLPGPDGQQYRALVCQTINPYGVPAKDRSGCLDMIEPPDLSHIIRKIETGKANRVFARQIPPPAQPDQPIAMAQTPQAPAAQPSQAEQGGPPPIPNFLRRTA